jgi:glycyl-radical enzyme activating protein
MNDQLSYFHISWLSETDGPGKRLVLFLQGCPLDCAWCHSPHSQPSESPLLYFDSLCTRCQRCADVCPNGVHSFEEVRHIINRELCVKCGRCIEACPQSSFYKPANALSLPTRKSNIGTLFKFIKPQLEFLRSEGGITFSGGEPLLQVEPLTLLARKCKEMGYHTALETSGIVPLKSIKTIAPYIDTWLFGMRLVTGTSLYTNLYLEEQVRKVFHLLVNEEKASVIVRIPAIYGYTDTPIYLNHVREIIGDFQVTDIEVLSHNKESSHYYSAMGIDSKVGYIEKDANTALQTIVMYFNIN